MSESISKQTTPEPQDVWAEESGIRLSVEPLAGVVVLTIYDVVKGTSTKATIADYRWRRVLEVWRGGKDAE